MNTDKVNPESVKLIEKETSNQLLSITDSF